eukprot:367574-Rhodomonas_salina.1
MGLGLNGPDSVAIPVVSVACQQPDLSSSSVCHPCGVGSETTTPGVSRARHWLVSSSRRAPM